MGACCVFSSVYISIHNLVYWRRWSSRKKSLRTDLSFPIHQHCSNVCHIGFAVPWVRGGMQFLLLCSRYQTLFDFCLYGLSVEIDSLNLPARLSTLPRLQQAWQALVPVVSRTIFHRLFHTYWACNRLWNQDESSLHIHVCICVLVIHRYTYGQRFIHCLLAWYGGQVGICIFWSHRFGVGSVVILLLKLCHFWLDNGFVWCVFVWHISIHNLVYWCRWSSRKKSLRAQMSFPINQHCSYLYVTLVFSSKS